MSILYRVETIGYRHITTIEADNRVQAERKAWRAISAKAPELVPILRKEGLIIYPDRGGCWGKNIGI